MHYKETELDESLLSNEFQSVLERIRQLLLENHFDQGAKVPWLPCHAIDLHQDGALKAHVDSVRFSGNVVAGLSLLSPSIMRFQPEEQQPQQQQHVDLYLPPRSLYVMQGTSRYQYTHELLESGSRFGDVVVERGHRLSVIVRDAKDTQ